MNNDFRLRIDFCDHVKTLDLEQQAGQGACWGLVRLIAYTANTRPDGDLRGLTDAHIEAIAHWIPREIEGHPELKTFPQILERAGFLEGGEGWWRFHDWAEHQPYVVRAPERSLIAKNAVETRWAKAAQRSAAGSKAARALWAKKREGDNSLNARLPLDAPGCDLDAIASCDSAAAPMRSHVSDGAQTVGTKGVPASDTPSIGREYTPNPTYSEKDSRSLVLSRDKDARQKRTPKAPKDDDDMQALRRFGDGHEQVFSAPYVAAFARDRKILRKLIDQLGLARVLEMIDAFWKEQDEFDPDPKKLRPVHNSKPNVPGFLGQIPNLCKTWTWDTTVQPRKGSDDAEDRRKR